jgi:hypothetical protein
MLLKYIDWLESSAATRVRREIALGLRTPVGMGSLHGHSTATPFEIDSITKLTKRKRKKRRKNKK